MSVSLQGLVVDRLDGILDGSPLQTLWRNVYSILVVVLGQELPDGAASFVDQAFALLVASAGLAAFALVLALVEQVSAPEAVKILHVSQLELPDGAASFVDQAFALLVASAGLAAFALVLALVEQVCHPFRVVQLIWLQDTCCICSICGSGLCAAFCSCRACISGAAVEERARRLGAASSG